MIRPGHRLSILGTRGIPAQHGGFETFAEHLARHFVARGWEVSVYCQDEDRQPAREEQWEGVRLLHIPQRVAGPLGTMIFDWTATRRAANEGGLVLTLGYNTALFLAWLKLRGVPNLINMDGIEWRRAKWGRFARLWLYLNERCAGWFADHLIADNPEIKAHLARHVAPQRITMIPYGAVPVRDADPALLERFGLVADAYALVIARGEPENSILEMICAFVARPRGLKLAIVGRYYPQLVPYHEQVVALARLHPDVLLLGPVYEPDVVGSLRFHARVHLHGHQVGGTNPSLVEALGAGSPCLVHDNPFNRWVGASAVCYFKSAGDCSAQLDQMLDNPSLLRRLRHSAWARHDERFRWEPVLNDYERLLAAWLPSCAGAAAAPSDA